MKKLGLYLHIPFCKSKCRYCDFCSFPNPKADTVEAYIQALIGEIGEQSQQTKTCFGEPPTVDTVYFGGGTPTLLSLPLWEKLMEAITRHFRISVDAEVTAECNPATADRQYFRTLRDLGINRLSIGAQSMNDSELKRLGRLHRADDVRITADHARAAGFDNLSLDVMFGIPDGTRQSLAETITAICDLDPDHVSVYGLQIEEGTYFARHKNELVLPDEDTERDMYMDAVRMLADRGLARYEISNFSRPDRASRHNLKYWRREDYLGLGIAAHSCLGNRRFSNTESLVDYLAGNKTATDEIISPHDILCETVMLGMRLDEGVDFSALAQAFGNDARRYRDKLLTFRNGGFVLQNGDRLSFGDDGMYVSNAILAQTLDFDR